MKKINQNGGLDFTVIVALVVVVVVGGVLFGRVLTGGDSGDDAGEIELQSEEEKAEEAEKAEVEEVEKKEEKKEEKLEDPAPVITGGLTLVASKIENGIALSWTDSGTDAKDGYKIVYSSSNTSPEYGVHKAQYANAGDKSSSVSLSDGLSYNFRVCAYRPDTGSCDSYSPTVVASAPKYEEAKVISGPMKIVKEGNTISWTFTGTAPHGFKVVINKTGSPKYPVDSVQYVGADSSSTELPKEAKGDYFVRVCKYTADANIKGGCTDYSNQIGYTVE